jgi:hypothetical protein
MRKLSAILFTLGTLVACGTAEVTTTEEPKPAEGAATTEAAHGEGEAKPAEAAPAAAALTKEGLNAAAADFPALAQWGETLAKAEAKLGKAMKVDGDKHMWWVKDGEQCVVLTATKAGEIVGGGVTAAGPCPTP